MASQFLLEGLEIKGREFSVKILYEKVKGVCRDFMDFVLLSDKIEEFSKEYEDYVWGLYTRLVNANEKMKDDALETAVFSTKTARLVLFIENIKDIKNILEEIEIDCCFDFDFEIDGDLKKDLFFIFEFDYK